MKKTSFNFQLDNELKKKLKKLADDRYTSIGSLLNQFAHIGIRDEEKKKIKRLNLSSLVPISTSAFTHEKEDNSELNEEYKEIKKDNRIAPKL